MLASASDATGISASLGFCPSRACLKVLDLPGLQIRKRSAGLVDLPGTDPLQVLPIGKTICTIGIAE
jgi:hypothetical protein